MVHRIAQTGVLRRGIGASECRYRLKNTIPLFSAGGREKPSAQFPHSRRVAAAEGLKNETFWTDLRILVNPAAERPAATAPATVLALSISDAPGTAQIEPLGL